MSLQRQINKRCERLHQLMVACSKELDIEARKNPGRQTKHYRTLKREMEKLKAEYDRELARGRQAPVDANNVQSKIAHQSRAIASAFERRAPEDTHFRGKS